MEERSPEEDLLLAIRRSPGSRAKELAEAIGLPRTNFGRVVKSRLREPLARLVSEGLIEQESSGYQLTKRGRKALADRLSS